MAWGGRLLTLAVLGLAAWGRPSVPQTRSLEEIRNSAEERIAARVQTLKTQPESPFYARTAHWNIHQYYGLFNQAPLARDALLTFLDKYEVDELAKKEAYDKLALYAADEKEWDAVLHYSEKYLSFDPGSYPRLLNKARALVNLGFLEEGRALLRRIVEEVPDSVQASLAAAALAELETAQFDPGLLAGYRTTMELMRQIGAAAEMYNVEHGKYPASIKDLYPVFLRELTEKDAWGNPFLIKSDPNAERFMIASPGSDNKFDGFDQKGSYVDLPGKDIIFAKGAFVFAPQIRRP